MLYKSLAEFGDIGGIVFNVHTKRLVGGHQRVEWFRDTKSAEVVITKRLKKADKAGSVAFGYVECNGERFTYREVDWDEAKEAAANLAANSQGGEFEPEQLSDIVMSLPEGTDLSVLGFDSAEIASFQKDSWQPTAEPIVIKDPISVNPDGSVTVTLTADQREVIDQAAAKIDSEEPLEVKVSAICQMFVKGSQ